MEKRHQEAVRMAPAAAESAAAPMVATLRKVAVQAWREMGRDELLKVLVVDKRDIKQLIGILDFVHKEKKNPGSCSTYCNF
jgi:hypothetical protein